MGPPPARPSVHPALDSAVRSELPRLLALPESALLTEVGRHTVPSPDSGPPRAGPGAVRALWLLVALGLVSVALALFSWRAGAAGPPASSGPILLLVALLTLVLSLVLMLGLMVVGVRAVVRRRRRPAALDVGRDFVYGPVRRILCSADNKALVTGAIDTATVGAVVSALAPQLGGSTTPPTALVAAAVLVLKIGVNELCRGYEPPRGPHRRRP